MWRQWHRMRLFPLFQIKCHFRINLFRRQSHLWSAWKETCHFSTAYFPLYRPLRIICIPLNDGMLTYSRGERFHWFVECLIDFCHSFRVLPVKMEFFCGIFAIWPRIVVGHSFEEECSIFSTHFCVWDYKQQKEKNWYGVFFLPFWCAADAFVPSVVYCSKINDSLCLGFAKFCLFSLSRSFYLQWFSCSQDTWISMNLRIYVNFGPFFVWVVLSYSAMLNHESRNLAVSRFGTIPMTSECKLHSFKQAISNPLRTANNFELMKWWRCRGQNKL